MPQGWTTWFHPIDRLQWLYVSLNDFIHIRYLPRFFDQVGHQTTSAYIENKHFFTKSCHHKTCQNNEQPSQSLQNLYFQSFFSIKNQPNLSKKISLWRILNKEINVYKVNFLKNLIFEVLCFLRMCPFFVGSVHDFGRSVIDII